MKKNLPFYTIILLFSFNCIFAQKTTESIADLNPKVVESWDTVKMANTFFVPFSYADANGHNLPNGELFKNKKITAIRLVYSRFRTNETYSQRDLNVRRLTWLHSYFPEWFEQADIQWELVEQVGCNNRKDCATFFHGFAISYISNSIEPKVLTPSKKIVQIAPRKEELGIEDEQAIFYEGLADFLDEYKIKLAYDPEAYKTSLSEQLETQLEDKKLQYIESKIESIKANHLLNEKSKKVEPTENIVLPTPVEEDNSTQKEPYQDKINKPRNDEYVKITKKYNFLSYFNKIDSCEGIVDDTTKCCLDRVGICLREGPIPMFSTDNTMAKVLNRKQYNGCKVSLTIDVTKGMMRAIRGGLFQIFNEAYFHKVLYMNFFNDGDKKEDSQKIVGSTGGIYAEKMVHKLRRFCPWSPKIDEAILSAARIASTSIFKGNGGDVAENPLEALLATLKNAPSEITEHYLVADNRSPIRDMALLPQIKVPIHIILPYTDSEDGLMNTEYLDVARATKGSVHTLNTDFEKLAQMKIGESFQYQKYLYRLTEKGFVCTEI